MKSIVIFGATGMIGQGVLHEALLDNSIEKVIVIGRRPTETVHLKLHQIIQEDLFDYKNIEDQLTGIDACLFCLGTPSVRKTEAEYSHITKDLTIAAAQTLLRLNPQLTFIYVSAEGADSSETSYVMWSRVRGKTENELLQMPFKKIFIFRPGLIQPLNGIKSRTYQYRLGYSLLKPILPILRYLFPGIISSTKLIGLAMIKVAREGYDKPILKTKDFYMV